MIALLLTTAMVAGSGATVVFAAKEDDKTEDEKADEKKQRTLKTPTAKMLIKKILKKKTQKKQKKSFHMLQRKTMTSTL